MSKPDNKEQLLLDGVMQARQQRAHDKAEFDLYKLRAARSVYMDNFVEEYLAKQKSAAKHGQGAKQIANALKHDEEQAEELVRQPTVRHGKRRQITEQAFTIKRDEKREKVSSLEKFGQNFYKNDILYYLLQELQFGERRLAVLKQNKSIPTNLKLNFKDGDHFIASLHRVFNSYFQEQYDILAKEIKSINAAINKARVPLKNTKVFEQQKRLSSQINDNLAKLAICEKNVRLLRGKESKLRSLVRLLSVENGYAFGANDQSIRESIPLALGQKAFQDHMAAFILKKIADDGASLETKPTFYQRLSKRLHDRVFTPERVLPVLDDEKAQRTEYHHLLVAEKTIDDETRKDKQRQIKAYEERITSSVRPFLAKGNTADNFNAIRQLNLPKEALIAIKHEIEKAARQYEVDFPNDAISTINEEINHKYNFSGDVLDQEILDTLDHFEDDKRRARSISTTRLAKGKCNEHLHEMIATALQAPDRIEIGYVEDEEDEFSDNEIGYTEDEEREISEDETFEYSSDDESSEEFPNYEPIPDAKPKKVRYTTLGAMMISVLNAYKKRIAKIEDPTNKDFYDAQVELVKDLSAIIANLNASDAQNYLKKQLSLFADINGLPKFIFNTNKLARNRQDQELVSDISREFIAQVKENETDIDANRPFDEKYVFLEDRINVSTKQKIDSYHTKLTINLISTELSLIVGFTEGLVAYYLLPVSSFIAKLASGISGAIVNFTLFDDYINSTLKGLVVSKWNEYRGMPLSRKQITLTIGLGFLAIFAGLGYGLLAFNSSKQKFEDLISNSIFQPFLAAPLKMAHAAKTILYTAIFLASVEFVGMSALFYLGVANFVKENKLPEIVHTLSYAVTSFVEDLARNWAYKDKNKVSPLNVGKFLLYSAVKTAFFSASIAITATMSIVYPLFFGSLMIQDMATYFPKISAGPQISKGLMYGPAAVVNNFFMGKGVIQVFNFLGSAFCSLLGLDNVENIPARAKKDRETPAQYEPMRFDLPSDKSARTTNARINFAFKAVAVAASLPNSAGQAGGPYSIVKSVLVEIAAFFSSWGPNLVSLLLAVSGITKTAMMRQPMLEAARPEENAAINSTSTTEINHGLSKRTIATMGTQRMTKIARNTVKFQQVGYQATRDKLFKRDVELRPISSSSSPSDLIRRRSSRSH